MSEIPSFQFDVHDTNFTRYFGDFYDSDFTFWLGEDSFMRRVIYLSMFEE